MISFEQRVLAGGGGKTDSLLGELAGTLVLGVAKQLNDAALVGGETGGSVRLVNFRCGEKVEFTQRPP